jgi:hypothetical protein
MDWAYIVASLTVSDVLIAIASTGVVLLGPEVAKWGAQVLAGMFGARRDPDEANEGADDPDLWDESVCAHCGVRECLGECRDNGA